MFLEDVREHIGHAELWRSTLTADAREGKVRASLWEAHFGSLFSELRRSAHRMRREQIDALVQGYLAAQLEHVEERLAVELDVENSDAWAERINDETLLTKVALTHGDLSETLPLARPMMPWAPMRHFGCSRGVSLRRNSRYSPRRGRRSTVNHW